jgi:hypothetical protein
LGKLRGKTRESCIKGWVTGRQSLGTRCGMPFPESKSKRCFPLLIPTNEVDLSKISNPYDKFRQTVGENERKRRPFVPKFMLEPVAVALGRPPIVRPYLEIAFGYDKFFGLYFSDIIWHYLGFGCFRDYFL